MRQTRLTRRLPPTAAAALRRLLDGNVDFVRSVHASMGPEEASRVLNTADPFAVVLGCSDSRVPPETVLREGLGRLFVVRVAGNVAGDAELASIEYAVARWRCPLVLVLGHTNCGAVGAGLVPPPPRAEAPAVLAGSPHVASLIDMIRSNILAVPDASDGAENASSVDRYRAAVEANARASAAALGKRSNLLARLVSDGVLAIVPAVYEVETGRVWPLDRQQPVDSGHPWHS